MGAHERRLRKYGPSFKRCADLAYGGKLAQAMTEAVYIARELAAVEGSGGPVAGALARRMAEAYWPRESERPGPLPARTIAEIHAYLDLHPCECGSALFRRSDMSISSAPSGGSELRFDGPCDVCRQPRDVTFQLAGDRPGLVPGQMAAFSFADDEPSAIIDAAQWLGMVEGLAAVCDPHLRKLFVPGGKTAMAGNLAAAANGADEVLKFLPAGAELPPATAFWTKEGTARASRTPADFSRDRLALLQFHRRGLLNAFTG